MDKLKESRYKELQRESANYGERNDCTVIAVAMTYNLSYAEAHKLLATKCRRVAGTGIQLRCWLGVVTKVTGIDYNKVEIAKQPNGCRYTVKTISNYLPIGCYLIFVHGHVLAMIDGHVYDWTDDRKYVVNEVFRIGDSLLELL